MKMKLLGLGATLVCPLLLPACSTPPKPVEIPPARPIVTQTCAPVVACRIPASGPQTNRQLAQSLLNTRAALEACAIQIDTQLTCQKRTSSQPL
ncbi:Rz1-like lysis system protein LysC [Chromobacterium haemolyticum]|uniref:Rz1-like lysis system protein LysC n=1 Tax=Chromobacterium haemolyticum TaxID=394935 RepID=UPI003B51A721